MAITKDPTKRNVNDGYFEINYRPDGVHLTVYPPTVNGQKVELRDVLDKITRKRIKDIDKDAIELGVFKSNKVPFKIANFQEEEKINSLVTTSISQDKMKGYIYINPPEGGRMLNLQEITVLLAKNGIVHGINNGTLENLCNYPVYNELILIAVGTEAKNGKAGKVEYIFDISKDRKPTILEDGRVDFRELNLIESVKKGTVLCTLIPPQNGVDGKNIMGGSLPAINGKPANLPRGKNTEITEDGQNLIATIDGQVNFIEGKVNVFAVYEVPADVDNSTGNIYFIGNVLIRGSVLAGFTVEAGGNIEVWGAVEGAVLKAQGDIILRRGMQGMGKGQLISGGDVIARYIENSTIEANEDIKAEAIMNSNVKCGKKLELAGKKGLLVGGRCRVGKEITAKVIGSHMYALTEVEVGIDPSLKEKYKKLKDDINQMESDIKKSEQAITILQKIESSGMLTPEKREMLGKSVRTKIYFTNKVVELKEEVAVIDKILQEDVNGKIRVNNYIYPGSKITIGTCSLNVKDTQQFVCFYRDGADIKMMPFDK